MKRNIFIEILASIPIILIAIYFSWFLGVVLIILRYFSTSIKRKNITPIVLVITGLLILIPKGLNFLFDKINFNPKDIPYFNDIVTSNLYKTNFMNYSKALIIIGIIFAVISYFIGKITNEIMKSFREQVQEYTNKQVQIEQENDLKMKEKQEDAKNTKVITCSKCGATNIVKGDIGKCKYCRNTLTSK